MSRDRDQAVGSVDELLALFREGETPRSEWRVGTEHEKIGLRAADHSVIPFEGENGVAELLARLVDADGWEPVREGEHTIALLKDGASITLEPGGQIELSGAPLRTIHETCDEFRTHLALMKRVSEPMGLVWLGLGINPVHGVDSVPVMPKARYQIMKSYLPTRGNLALDMMFTTATVQANFDYESEADMATKMRAATAVSPIVSAIFANSSLSEGKANGYVSKRMHIWHHTDPDRCGLLAMVFEPDFGYRNYLEWAVDVPMFFVVRDGEYRFAEGTTFRQFVERGFGEARATRKDFDTHLTTLFPDVRLKHIIEVRGADAVPPDLTCSLPALWKGLLYDDEALAASFDLVADAEFSQREAARTDVARHGLGGSYAGRQVLELARELVPISRAGLRRIGHAGRRDPDETSFLDPVQEQLEAGESPGQTVAKRWEGEWGRSLERLIEYAQY